MVENKSMQSACCEKADMPAAIVLAAGMSTRMGELKPLLELGDKPLICHTVDRLHEGGVGIVMVVTGFRSAEIRSLLSQRKFVHFVQNSEYESTDMLRSIQIGVDALRVLLGDSFSAFFLVPGDIPLFKAQTIKVLHDAYCANPRQLLWKPVYRKSSGHPILLSGRLVNPLLSYKGTGGLKQFLVECGCIGAQKDSLVQKVNVPDPGILLDADTPADFERLQKAWDDREIPDIAQCFSLLRFYHTPSPVVRHVKATARCAIALLDTLQNPAQTEEFVQPESVATRMQLPAACELPMNRCLVKAAALLHDIARGNERHEVVGAGWLNDWGFCLLADIIAVHMDLPASFQNRIGMTQIVYLADKRTVKDRSIPLNDRMAILEEKLRHDPIALQAARRRMEVAAHIEQMILRHAKTVQERNTGIKY